MYTYSQRIHSRLRCRRRDCVLQGRAGELRALNQTQPCGTCDEVYTSTPPSGELMSDALTPPTDVSQKMYKNICHQFFF